MPIPSPAYQLNAKGYRSSTLGYPAGMTFARGTVAWSFNAAGLLVQAASTALRHDWDPITKLYLGWLMEGSRTNVCLYNRDLTNAAWTKTNVTAAKDQVGIDGVAASASKITASSSNGTCLQSITLASSARYQTAWIKRVTGTGTLEMTMDNGSTWTDVTALILGTGPNGYSRVYIATQTLANPTVGFRIGTNGDAFAVDFVQNENGIFATSPIETSGSSVARSADSLSIATTSIPILYWQGAFLFEGDVIGLDTSSDQYLFQAADGSVNNEVRLRLPGSLALNPRVASGGSAVASLAPGSVVVNTPFKLAFGYAVDNFRASKDGAAESTDASGAAPAAAFTTLSIGSSTGGGGPIQGHIKRLAYYSVPLTSQQARAMAA